MQILVFRNILKIPRSPEFSIIAYLEQDLICKGFSNFCMYTNYLGTLLKNRF